MRLVICPGIHDPQLTQSFLGYLLEDSDNTQLPQEICQENPLIFPTESYPAYSGPHLLQFITQQLNTSPFIKHSLQPPLVFVGFSAGVVSAIEAAWGWRLLGGTVTAFIALDGWGVPLWGDFPIHRVSHDYFTHWSSALLGQGEDGFYADPGVDHLELWRSPHTVEGWSIPSTRSHERVRTTATRFLLSLLHRYARKAEG